jgi:putative transposase
VRITAAASAAPCRDPLYRGYRFPGEIISHAVWLYFRFALSHRDVEELLAERGVQVSYEAIRRWCQRFGPTFAGGLRRRRARSADKWHLDEVQLKIKGRKHWLWRAVDRDGLVLDILVQERRNQEAAERFLRRVLDGGGAGTAGGGHGQAGQLPTSAQAGAAWRGAPAAQGPE